MLFRGSRIPLLFALSVMLVQTACYHGHLIQDINFDDHDRLTPAAQVAYEIYPGIETRRRGSVLAVATGRESILGAPVDGPEVEAVTVTFGVAGGFATVDGREAIGVESGRRIEFAVEIPGPTVVDTRVENHRGHAGVVVGGRFWDIVSVSVLLGVGVDDTEVALRSSAFSGREQRTEAAFASSFRLAVRPIPLFDLYGQATFMFGDFASADLEAGCMLNLTRNLGVYGGYRRWAYDYSDFADGESDIEVRFHGPTVGARVMF